MEDIDYVKESEKFDPILSRVLIYREKSAIERKLEKSNLLAPDSVRDGYKSAEGVLVRCSEDCDPQVTALLGKKILFSKYCGDEIKVGECNYTLAMDTDIMGEIK